MQNTLWGLSNIACHNNDQVVSAFVSNSIFKTVVGCLDSTELAVRIEALHTVSNAITTAETLVVHQMFTENLDMLDSFLKGLKLTSRASVILAILDAVEHLC